MIIHPYQSLDCCVPLYIGMDIRGQGGLLIPLGLAFLACTASEISLADSRLPRTCPQYSNFVPQKTLDSISEHVFFN